MYLLLKDAEEGKNFWYFLPFLTFHALSFHSTKFSYDVAEIFPE
jgi:hypothetical protein